MSWCSINVPAIVLLFVRSCLLITLKGQKTLCVCQSLKMEGVGLSQKNLLLPKVENTSQCGISVTPSVCPFIRKCL